MDCESPQLLLLFVNGDSTTPQKFLELHLKSFFPPRLFTQASGIDRVLAKCPGADLLFNNIRWKCIQKHYRCRLKGHFQFSITLKSQPNNTLSALSHLAATHLATHEI